MNFFRNLVLVAVLHTIPVTAQSIVNSPHDLSAVGTATIKSTTESQICIFCHAVHNGSGNAPLWNRFESAVTYTLYGSPSLQSTTQQPDIQSKMCLSCHDGTVALGLVQNKAQPIAFPAGLDKIPTANRSNLSADLSDDHPINLNMTVHPSGEYSCNACHPMNPTMQSLNLTCISCHDPHDNSNGDFLIMNPVNGALCITCHNRTDWATSIHATSIATWNSTAPDPWPFTTWTNVAQNACHNCHDPHGVASDFWLLKQVAEEDNCLVCHNGNVAAVDIEGELLKLYKHSVASFSGIHTPKENPQTMTRHVECTDCHNPHRVDQSVGTVPAVSGALKGVQGIDANGGTLTVSANEYEVCFKCHQNNTASTTFYVNRTDPQPGIRQEFNTVNPSYHPVEAAGKNNDVPSLLAGWSTSSMMYCTDCHGNNIATGPKGPHASNEPAMLRLNMTFTDYVPESASTYELCYSCHNRQHYITKGMSAFKEHREHVLKKETSCTTCHDPHGSQNNTHLISFNTDYVTPSINTGRLEWNDLGSRKGECYLTCHGEDHDPFDY